MGRRNVILLILQDLLGVSDSNDHGILLDRTIAMGGTDGGLLPQNFQHLPKPPPGSQFTDLSALGGEAEMPSGTFICPFAQDQNESFCP